MQINAPEFGVTASPGQLVKNAMVTHARQDSFRSTGDAALVGCTSRDLLGRLDPAYRNLAHRDHYQPLVEKDGYFNQQYAAAEITQVLVQDCLLYSPDTQMQGIFMADGFVRYLMLIDNDIITASEHKITVCALDGVIKGNKDATGTPVLVNLVGLRIGGGLRDRPRIKILSFDGDDQYTRSDLIVHEEPRFVLDERETFDDNTIHLEGFDLEAFRHAAKQVKSHDECTNDPRGANAMCVDFWALAQQYGTPVRRYL